MRIWLNANEVERSARENCWRRIDWQPNIVMLSYERDGVRMNVYLTKGTVSTSMRHPKKGKTQLFRRRISLEEIKKIFKKPRAHTGTGYYRRDER